MKFINKATREASKSLSKHSAKYGYTSLCSLFVFS